MATLTYDKAVKDYKSHVAKLHKDFVEMKQCLDRLLKSTSKHAESFSGNEEAKVLSNLMASLDKD